MQACPDDCLPATAYKSWDIKKANIRLCMRAFLPMLNDLALPLHAPPTPPPHSWTVRWHLGRSAHQEEKQTKQNVKALRAGISSVSTFRGTRAVSWSPTGLGVGGGGRLTFSPPLPTECPHFLPLTVWSKWQTGAPIVLLWHCLLKRWGWRNGRVCGAKMEISHISVIVFIILTL